MDAPQTRPLEWRSRFHHGKEEAMPETYGDAPGWGGKETTSEPVAPPESPQGALGASPPPDAEAAPSADEAQPQVSEQAPPPPSQPEPEKKWNMPPEQRWEELRRERDEARKLAELALQKLQAPQAVAPSPADDHWKGLVDHPDPATAQFYQQQRALFQKEAERMADQKLQGVLQAVDAGRRELAGIKIAQFRKENPDITPGSPEETTIANYVQQGVDLESAKKLALYDKLETENRALKAKQATIPQKRAANTERSAGIPQTAGLPPAQGDWKDRAGEIIDKGGNMRDAFNAIFGGKR